MDDAPLTEHGLPSVYQTLHDYYAGTGVTALNRNVEGSIPSRAATTESTPSLVRYVLVRGFFRICY
jgi:hypothetical protein